VVLRRFTLVLAFNLMLGAVANSSVLAAEDSSKVQSYTIASLADIAGADHGDAVDIDDRGHVVGQSGPHAVLQQAGKLNDLGLPGGRTASWGFGTNDRGEIVGGANDATGFAHAAVWDNGRWTELPYLPGGKIAEAHAVNARGQVVGYSTIDAIGTRHAVLWDNNRAPIDLRTLPGDTHSEARGINDRGEIVGESYTTIGPRHAVVWRNGAITPLPLLPGGGDSAAYAINARGQIAGFSGLHAAVWDTRGGVTDLGALPGSATSRAYGINDRGQVVGSSDVAYYPHAVLWDRGVATDLGNLAGGPQSEARAINERGQIVGQAYDTTGHTHAVIWDRSHS
jgi:probable HAF family extracellular repeat protein